MARHDDGPDYGLADYSDEGRKEQPTEDARVDAVLQALGAELTAENREQMRVYLTAFEVFVERNRRHRAQWRVSGVQGLLFNIRNKTERMWNEFMLSPNPPTDYDSAIDSINYLAFLVQALKEEHSGSKVGNWIWPERNRK